MSIFDVRLRISDPAGFIAFEEVSVLPAIPANQTAYKLTTDGNYYSTDKLTGVIASDYEIEELLISDERLQNWIDLEDEDYAVCQSIKAILPQLGKQMQLARIGTGAESVAYQTLRDVYYYYKDLSSECTKERKVKAGNNTGRMGAMKVPEIAGGEI